MTLTFFNKQRTRYVTTRQDSDNKMLCFDSVKATSIISPEKDKKQNKTKKQHSFSAAFVLTFYFLFFTFSKKSKSGKLDLICFSIIISDLKANLLSVSTLISRCEHRSRQRQPPV